MTFSPHVFAGLLALSALALGVAVFVAGGEDRRAGVVSDTVAVSRLFNDLDANDDGRLTADELAEARDRRFRRVDRDGDGQLTVEELTPEGAETEGAADPTAGVEAFIAGMDRDGDGRLSRDEAAAAPSPLLLDADANGDGAVDAGEFAEAMARARAEAQGGG